MPRNLRPALDAAVALYAGFDARARLHVRLRRSLSCFEYIERLVPRSGRILEIGCGHGLFSNYLALASPDRQVQGIDIDDAKIALARRTRGRVSFRTGDARFPPEGPFDAAVIVDVLYLLPAEMQAQALAAARGVLKSGGVLVWKSQELQPAWKHAICRTQEWLAVRAGLTAGDSINFASRERALRLLADAGFARVAVHVPKGRIYPDVVYVASA